MILGRDLLKSMGLDIKLSRHIIKGGDKPFGGCTNFMMDMITYDYVSLNLNSQLKPEESFMDDQIEENSRYMKG